MIDDNDKDSCVNAVKGGHFHGDNNHPPKRSNKLRPNAQLEVNMLCEIAMGKFRFGNIKDGLYPQHLCPKPSNISKDIRHTFPKRYTEPTRPISSL